VLARIGRGDERSAAEIRLAMAKESGTFLDDDLASAALPLPANVARLV
jgi:hypothetical protein